MIDENQITTNFPFASQLIVCQLIVFIISISFLAKFEIGFLFSIFVQSLAYFPFQMTSKLKTVQCLTNKVKSFNLCFVVFLRYPISIDWKRKSTIILSAFDCVLQLMDSGRYVKWQAQQILLLYFFSLVKYIKRQDKVNIISFGGDKRVSNVIQSLATKSLGNRK